jgi:hypothetical protein
MNCGSVGKVSVGGTRSGGGVVQWPCAAQAGRVASRSCPWRIGTGGVKKLDSRSAQQPGTQTPDDLIGSLPKVYRSRSDPESLENHPATSV